PGGVPEEGQREALRLRVVARAAHAQGDRLVVVGAAAHRVLEVAYRQTEALVVDVEQVAPGADPQELAVGVDLDAALVARQLSPRSHVLAPPPCGPQAATPTCTAETPPVCSL